MSVVAETTADIKVPPQPAVQQMEEIILYAQVGITVKLTISQPTNQAFIIPKQNVDLQFQFNPQATAKLKYYEDSGDINIF